MGRKDERPEIKFPDTMHHETVKRRLNTLVEKGEIDADTATETYWKWLKGRRQRSK